MSITEKIASAMNGEFSKFDSYIPVLDFKKINFRFVFRFFVLINN